MKPVRCISFLLALMLFMMCPSLIISADVTHIHSDEGKYCEVCSPNREKIVITRALVCDCGGNGHTTHTGIRFTELGTCSERDLYKHYYRDTVAYQSCQACGTSLGMIVINRVHYCDFNGDNPPCSYY